jgi:hypothetical protein
MAQTGFTPISLYYTATAAATPTAGNLVAGELAINTNDGKLFYKDSAGVVQTIASKNSNSGTFTNISVSSVATFGAGTVSAPAITTTGDTNTGIFFPAADTIAFTEGGVESMRIDSSGNLGIGATSIPSSVRLYQYVTAGTCEHRIESSNTSGVITRWKQNGVDVGYAASANTTVSGGSATDFAISAPTANLVFATGTSERMRIDSSGNVGIGASSGGAKLQITSASSGGQLSVSTATNGGIVVTDGTYTGIMYASGVGGIVAGTTSAHPYILFANNAERMRIASDGSVGIGTGIPVGKLQIDLNTASTVVNNLTLNNNAGGAGNGTAINFYNSDALQPFTNRINSLDDGNFGFHMVFSNKVSGSSGAGALTERMRIDSSGNLLVGDTSGSHHKLFKDSAGGLAAQVYNSSTNTSSSAFEVNTNYTGNTTGWFIRGGDNAAYKFYIYSNGNMVNSNNSYGAISDIKLKENIADASPKLDKLMNVKVRTYNLIGDTQKQIGVVAQELEEIFPSMIQESPDRDEEGNVLDTVTKQVKYSVFVPMLIKAIQEQQAMIETLTTRLNALEGK